MARIALRLSLLVYRLHAKHRDMIAHSLLTIKYKHVSMNALIYLDLSEMSLVTFALISVVPLYSYICTLIEKFEYAEES